MTEPGDLALRLSEATDAGGAAALLAEHLRARCPDASVRIYILGPGDLCASCPRAADCAARDKCLHLEAGRGTFARPAGHDQRIPRIGTTWGDVLRDPTGWVACAPPAELAAPEDHEGSDRALLCRLECAGELIGVAGVRCPEADVESLSAELRSSALLTAATIHTLQARITANRRFEQLLLVNDLGRKVNSILNDELLLRQAAVDIHRTFGFHNVMIFMVNEDRTHLELRAQSSRYADAHRGHETIVIGEGVIGRAYRSARTEIIDDVSLEQDYVDWYSDTKSEVAIPIQISGVVEGVLNVESDRIGAFGASDRLVLETVANQLAIAIENARLFSMVKEREDRYRALVENSPGGVLHLDAEGRIIYANPAVTDITGHEKSWILSRIGKLTDLAVAGDNNTLQEAIGAALRGVPCRDMEFHLSHADGGVRWVTASLQPLLTDNGEPRGVVVLMRDKTRERELQEKLTQSEKLSAIGTLVSGVAHELNNPLAGILGFAQLLLGRPPEQWTHADLEKIEKNAKRCRGIVENLLSFARQSRMPKRLANINEVIESVLNLMDFQLRNDNVGIRRDFDSRIPPFALDRGRWQQVFTNLTNNAHDAVMAREGEDREIRFETRLVGERVTIRVADSGPGVSKHKRSRIFDPFFTTKDKGTGLGLSICFGIVQDQGGTIGVEQSEMGGAAFVIDIPVETGSETSHGLRPRPRPEPTTGNGNGRRVLVVDDDAYVCDVVSRALQNHGYEVLVAREGSEALRMARDERLDVVVSDVRMPGDIDGIELFDALTRERPTLARNFVFMTGNTLDNRTMGRLESLDVRFVEKPFDIHHLASIVGEVVAKNGSSGQDAPAPDTEEPPATGDPVSAS